MVSEIELVESLKNSLGPVADDYEYPEILSFWKDTVRPFFDKCGPNTLLGDGALELLFRNHFGLN